jgi:uncharacterized membrane protein
MAFDGRGNHQAIKKGKTVVIGNATSFFDFGWSKQMNYEISLEI